MKKMLVKLRDMCDIAHFIMTRGIAVGTLLHIASLAAIWLSGLEAFNTYHCLEYAACLRETGVAVYLVTVVGSAFLEETVHKQ